MTYSKTRKTRTRKRSSYRPKHRCSPEASDQDSSWRNTKASRLKAAILSHLMESKNKDFPHNFFITFAMPALPVLEASALLKFQQFCRVLRDQVKDRGRGLSYLWVAGVGAKQGYHIHMTLHWPHRDGARLHHQINRFWRTTLSPYLRNGVALKSNCSSIYISPLTTSEQSYEHIALYFSGHVLKHTEQPNGRCFGRSKTKN